MWPGAVEIRHIRAEYAPQVRLAQDEHVVQAFPSHAAQEALAGRVGPRGGDGRAQHADPARRGQVVETWPVLAVVVADKESGGLPEGRGLAQLLRGPGVGWVARHADVDDAARAERVMKNAYSGRKRRSVTGRTSQAQISWA